MKISGIIGVVAAAVILASSVTLMCAQNDVVAWDFPDFSATQVFHFATYDMSMKVYRSGSSVRMERSAAWSTLYTPFKIYNLTSYPDGSHQCVVLRPDQVKMLPSPLELLNGTKVERTPADKEVVEGHTCKVENVVVTRPDGKIIHAKVWEAEDLKGAPVKIEAQMTAGTFSAVYHDIVLGTPDKALFTAPDKCTPYEKMGQVVEQVNVK